MMVLNITIASNSIQVIWLLISFKNYRCNLFTQIICIEAKFKYNSFLLNSFATSRRKLTLPFHLLFEAMDFYKILILIKIFKNNDSNSSRGFKNNSVTKQITAQYTCFDFNMKLSHKQGWFSSQIISRYDQLMAVNGCLFSGLTPSAN